MNSQGIVPNKWPVNVYSYKEKQYCTNLNWIRLDYMVVNQSIYICALDMLHKVAIIVKIIHSLILMCILH